MTPAAFNRYGRRIQMAQHQGQMSEQKYI